MNLKQRIIKIGNEPIVFSAVLLLLSLSTIRAHVPVMVEALAEPPVQEKNDNAISVQNSALLPESWARKAALTSPMPKYPEEAIRLGISEVVYIRFETSPEGEVLRIKVRPRTDPFLSKAVADAVQKWKFKPWPGADGLVETVFSRLAFRFDITNGVPQVGLHNPGPHSRPPECLECSNSNKEMDEWRDWERIWSKSSEATIDSLQPSQN